MPRLVRNCEESEMRHFPLCQRYSETHVPSIFVGEILNTTPRREEFDDNSECLVYRTISDNLSHINPVTIKNSK